MNGVGITLAAILSHRFQVDCVDPKAMLHLTQRCVQNMSTVHPPEVKRVRKKELKKGFLTTVVKFTPDLTRFQGIEDLTPMQALVKTRMTQLSATLGGRVKFWFNDERIGVDTFKKYMGLFRFEKSMFETLTPRFEYGFSLADAGEFRHDSFVNNLATTEGGTHVNIVTSQLVAVISDHFAKKFKKSNAKLSKAAIKNKLHVFVNCRITNPEFRSQVRWSHTVSSIHCSNLRLFCAEQILPHVVAAEGGLCHQRQACADRGQKQRYPRPTRRDAELQGDGLIEFHVGQEASIMQHPQAG